MLVDDCRLGFPQNPLFGSDIAAFNMSPFGNDLGK